MGLRERKKAETRAALSWAAVRLTVERGYDNVKVDDIAEAAGVSPRTFNNYFSSKGEAIVARHVDRLTGIADELRERPADEPLWEAISHSVLLRFQPDVHATASPPPEGVDWAAGVHTMVTHPALQGEMLRGAAKAEAEIAAAVAERTGADLTEDQYPHLVAAAVAAAINTATAHHLRTDQQTSLRELLEDGLARLAVGFS
jgi:AcrR family transcriptional regulator